MIISLVTAIVVSLFAVGAGLLLLWRFRDWRFGFLAGLALVAAVWVLVSQLVQLSGEAGGVSNIFEDYQRGFPALVLSIMALSVMFFLERIIRRRTETEQNLKLAQVSLEHVTIPVFWFTPEGEIRYVNKGAREFLGYSEEELLSMTIHDVAPLYLPAQWLRDWSSLKKGRSINTELYYSTKDGQLVPVDVAAIYMGSKDRDLGCMFVRDITERKEAEADLHGAMARAETANRAKSEFLATMSHELRTPLNAIIGFSEVIKEQTFGPVGSPKYRSYAEDINDSGQHLLTIINDILDLSKVEAGVEELYEENIRIPNLVQSVARLVRQRAETGGVELKLDIRDQLPSLWADKRKLKQILVNLLANAVKYTEPGGVVTFRAWCRADSGFVFQMADTGIGIAAGDIPKALSRFGQIDSDLNRKHEGTGLGLPLSKALVELHSGSLDLQSQLGVGTTVTVRFPPNRLIQTKTAQNPA